VTIGRDDFAAFFAALHGGHTPFRWQERLLDELLGAGEWPARIVAPTGAGKTAAIDVHVFAVALTAGLDEPRLPRRLSMVVGRRVLVDDQYEHAVQVARALRDSRDGILAAVAARLRTLRRPADLPDNDDPGPLLVARLRGGVLPSRDWRDDPTSCAVICATPDMWGSRLLFRGYGTAPRARSREAGLLALDSAVVVDEAHLSRQLLETARGVARLVLLADEPLPVPCLQVVETTATPMGTGTPVRSVEVVADDLADEPVLRDRMTKPKPVQLISTKDWPASTPVQRRRVAALLAGEVVELVAQPAPASAAVRTVGCYVNTVPMAVEVAHALSTHRIGEGRQPRVVMVCGQNRPADLHRLPPGVLSVDGNPEVDILVTTQSLEVGVDLDLAGVVTELAPGSALTQRAGRANRRGIRPDAPVHVIVPDGRIDDNSRSGPYLSDELAEALEWLGRRADDPSGLAPWSVQHDPPSPARHQRSLYQRPEPGDAWHWARTCDDLAAEPELDLWLAESFEQDNTAGVVVRDAMPPDTAGATFLVRTIPPRDDEVFTVPVAVARSVVAQSVHQFHENVEGGERPLAVRRRGDDIVVVDPVVTDPANIDPERIDIRPGDLVVIDSRTAAFTPSHTGSDWFSPPTPVNRGQDSAGVLALGTADDLLHAVREPRPGQVVLRMEADAWPKNASVAGILKQYAELDESASGTARRQLLHPLLAEFATELGDHTAAPMVRAAADLLRCRVQDSDIIPDGEPLRLIVLDRRRAQADDWMRQTWLPGTRQVSLDKHQAAVGDRAEWISRCVHLPAQLTDALREAGHHHDDGKADPRFQDVLGATDQLLAKSGGKPLADFRESARRAGLPTGWRHEQRSVVDCWAILHTALPEEYAELAVRLVGTSHGYGRHGFPHAGTELLAGDISGDERRLAEDLFDLGGWDSLIESTHHRWGVWGCAYLEALLRAADGQASGEDK
jgi:CRISPR-associated endonuclease/helicase Cas3